MMKSTISKFYFVFFIFFTLTFSVGAREVIQKKNEIKSRFRSDSLNIWKKNIHSVKIPLHQFENEISQSNYRSSGCKGKDGFLDYDLSNVGFICFLSFYYRKQFSLSFFDCQKDYLLFQVFRI